MVHTDIPQESLDRLVHLGTAGWNIRRDQAHRFTSVGTHLERYARVFNAVEINSCFYRPHRLGTYERWAASVPEGFRFAVKLPKSITHEARLLDPAPALERFLSETAGLGRKRGPILVQLPPSLAFDRVKATRFFSELRNRYAGDAVLEPRHPTWFEDEVEEMLEVYQIARVIADPPPVPAAAHAAGADHVVYLRLHGSPRIYYSAYSREELDRVARIIEDRASLGVSVWCIFDNTALGAATADACAVRSQLSDGNERDYE
jgi:uncharacterized protein YecE (DUF72 family)